MMHYTILVDIYPTHNKKNLSILGCFMTINRLYGTITTIECSKMKAKKLRAFKNGIFSSRLIILI